MSELEQPAKRGRPPGEVTPEGLIRQELIAHLKLYRSTRELIQKRFDKESDTMDPDSLGKFMDILRKGIAELVKSIVPQAKAGEAKPETSEEDVTKILSQLIEGKKER